MNVTDAVLARRSCRAFLPRPVDEALIRDILDVARHTPSGGNLQPWHVYGLAGDPLRRLVAGVAEKMAITPRGEGTEYEIYPSDLKEPYTSRRFQCGEDLYASLGISRDDKPGRVRQFKKNFQLFGAPAGLFFFIDRQMQPGQWADLGMYIQTVMLLATSHGLATCAQEAWAGWHRTIQSHLDAPENLMLFCGMAIGYQDPRAPVNTLRTGRADPGEVATLTGF